MLDGKETELEIIDHPSAEMSVSISLKFWVRCLKSVNGAWVYLSQILLQVDKVNLVIDVIIVPFISLPR